MYEFILPDIGEGISEAMLIAWSVELGQHVNEGDEIATVSTDKVDVELPAPRAGVVGELCWKPGDTIKVGSVFMRIDTGEAAPDAPPKSPAAKKKSAAKNGKENAPSKSAAQPAAAPPPGGSVIAAPSTRKLASDRGIDLTEVSGSGPQGRILRADLDRQGAGNQAGASRREPLNTVRAAMAERMAQSAHTLAHSTMNFEMRADAFMALLDTLRPGAEAAGVRVSPTALLAKCLDGPLRRNPRFNATIVENERELLLHDDVNLSFAVATDRGLMVPVLPRINGKPLFALARDLRELVERTRAGKLGTAEIAGGTFTLSNTGGMERAAILSTRPIINAPQTATLWISKVQQRPVVVDGQLTAGLVMNASLSFDHRFVDGADGVAFINDVAAMIETPEHALAGE